MALRIVGAKSGRNVGEELRTVSNACLQAKMTLERIATTRVVAEDGQLDKLKKIIRELGELRMRFFDDEFEG